MLYHYILIFILKLILYPKKFDIKDLIFSHTL